MFPLQNICFFLGSTRIEGVLKFSDVVSILNWLASVSSESLSFEFNSCFHHAKYIVGSPNPRNFSCSRRGFGRPFKIHSWHNASSGYNLSSGSQWKQASMNLMNDLSTPSSRSIKLFVLGLHSFPFLFLKDKGLYSSSKNKCLLVAWSKTLIGGTPLYSMM